ncbi:MAG: hypothetical protein COV91_00250 [Candidatus Taylorbacteria bacterium CG11_big_fil_rev_8_21_14_0_20_46_11]|uniref:DUF2914 domain-containing protein n=1 Tax=Candidatus Taylorbacteria bacterium CG11_big_fil_rev_8_21_14_0_20_46_11 TaxID=1975025 RepID=A0A2H0KD32_9BACT|nr:MAG: hypothetical protein COV91_00250 [Candidatus Taylorbacteria bacterium CG11_big_fil_rev_8_21_14_0_20_46_11]
MLERTKSFLERHERRLSISAFLGGFLWDSLTLTRIDRLYENLMLGAYLLIAFAGIVLLNAHGAGRLRGAVIAKGMSLIRFALPFAFGGLFSGFLIFYFRSGTVLASAPFLLALLVFFLGNELWKKHYERFTFQMSIFFVALFSYITLVVPVFVKQIGTGVFVGSGILALVVFFLLVKAIHLVSREEVERSYRTLIPMVIIIFITFNFLYFNNMIPPIPLALKESGVYHSISRTKSGSYILSSEYPMWYEFGRQTGAVFHRKGNEPVYAWSSIYAPTKFDTSIVHRWLHLDDMSGEWVSEGAIPFAISGGRLEGFRGYSVKSNISPGKWRVDVETPRGAVIGRLTFTIVDSNIAPPLTIETR